MTVANSGRSRVDLADEHDWACLFRALPAVRTLVVSMPPDVGELCLALAARAAERPARATACLLPHLRALTLEYVYVLDAAPLLMGMLERNKLDAPKLDTLRIGFKRTRERAPFETVVETCMAPYREIIENLAAEFVYYIC